MISVLTNITNSNRPAHSLLTQSPLQYKAKMFDATLMGTMQHSGLQSPSHSLVYSLHSLLQVVMEFTSALIAKHCRTN